MSTEQYRLPEPELPPMRPSDEADAEQLLLAQQEGAAYGRAVEMMKAVADDLQTVRVDDYDLSVAVEKAEGLYALDDDQLRWEEPADANAHIEVVVRDASDGRFVPGLTVLVMVYDAQGREVGRAQQHFLWHPWLYHYGRNWKVPGEGDYRVHVHVDPATFHRHDPINGRRYVKATDADFTVHVTPGRK